MESLFRASVAAARREWTAWALLAVSLFLTWRYRWVLDDAFVYFRYAENFAQRRQLVYNVGEHVEGFTSPVWMALLAATRTMGFRFWPVVMSVSLASVVAFHLLVLRTNDALAPPGSPRVYLPLALLLTNYAVLSHFGSGMETPLVQVCAAGFAYLVVSPASTTAQLVMSLAPVVRPELLLPFAVGLSWSWWRCRRFPRVLGICGGALGLFSLLFRIRYYNDFFPNTYYLKEADHWRRGVSYLLDTFTQYHLHAWLAALLAGTMAVFIAHRAEARLAERSVIWIGAALVVFHVVRVGGDFVHYRYFAFAVPALIASFGGIAESLVQRIPRYERVAAASMTAVAAILMATAYPTRQLPAHPLGLGRHDRDVLRGLASFSHDNIEDSMRHRSVDLFDPSVWDVPEGTHPVPSRYTDLTITGLCAFAYERMDLYTIHGFGLTTPALARLPVPEGAQAGHKWNLFPYARALAGVYAATRAVSQDGETEIRLYPQRGAFRAAVASRRAPFWVEENLRELELVEMKSYGEHDLRTSFRLAFTKMPLFL